MAKKVGTLIKEARTEAGLTQEQLARKVKGVSASDISKAERGELDLTQAALKEIAKATGVTQASLINAAKGTSAKKTSSSKTGTAKKTSSTKKSSSSKTSMQVSSTERKLVELYREADSDTKKAAMSLLKGETTSTQDILSSLLENAVEMLGAK